MPASQKFNATDEDFFSATLSQSDPEIAEAIELELSRQRDDIELIASENIVSRAVLEAQGSVLDQQIRRGPAGKALLRRLSVRRYCRAPGDRASVPSFRLQFRQCAAAFRGFRQCGSFHGADAARRHLYGPQPCRRRTSHPRLAGQPFRPLVQSRALWRPAR